MLRRGDGGVVEGGGWNVSDAKMSNESKFNGSYVLCNL